LTENLPCIIYSGAIYPLYNSKIVLVLNQNHDSTKYISFNHVPNFKTLLNILIQPLKQYLETIYLYLTYFLLEPFNQLQNFITEIFE
jgi:hypothetical protein